MGAEGIEAVRLLAFCEAPADFTIASNLIDRVLRACGPAWVGDVLDPAPEGVRSWHPDQRGNRFFDLHRIDRYLADLHVKPRYGHFDGEPGADGAAATRNAMQIAAHLIDAGDEIDAVVVIWDLDDAPEERLKGLAQASGEASRWDLFEIVIGCPNAMREAWVLAGFVVEDEGERQRLAELRRELGFDPTEHAHRLDSNDEQAKRSPKRVLRVLSEDDHRREERCWRETPLDVLKARGGDNGLADYLDQIERVIVPLVTAAAK